jgi:cytochrome c biogenesis protein CcmG, thiol:disulfide interchange protein DsbE
MRLAPRLLALLAAALLAGCAARPEHAAAPLAAGDAVIAAESRLLDGGSGRLAPGDPAPDFSFTLPDGTTRRLSDLQGTPVIVNFWATWCLPCREEMPALQAGLDAREGALHVLAVNRNELPEAMARFATEVPVRFPLVADLGGAIGDRYGVTALPTTYFIAGDGTIGAIHLGALTPAVIDDRLEAIQ